MAKNEKVTKKKQGRSKGPGETSGFWGVLGD